VSLTNAKQVVCRCHNSNYSISMHCVFSSIFKDDVTADFCFFQLIHLDNQSLAATKAVLNQLKLKQSGDNKLYKMVFFEYLIKHNKCNNSNFSWVFVSQIN